MTGGRHGQLDRADVQVATTWSAVLSVLMIAAGVQRDHASDTLAALRRIVAWSHGRKKTDVTSSRGSHEPDMPNEPDEQPRNVGLEENDIDQILADSFPASDAPPWTLGVRQTPAKNVPKRTRRRG